MAILARRSGPRRRALADINVVPYIDVMLVLVVILMVAAPFVNPSLVNLPTVGKSSRAPTTYFKITIDVRGQLSLREGAKDLGAKDIVDTVALLVERQKANPANPPPVVIEADKDVKYDRVMQVMSELQLRGVQKVGLLVKPAPSATK